MSSIKKPSLAFVDHSAHLKSHSGDFLREIFKDQFEITDYFDESWKGGKTVSPEIINKHDFVFYFQSINPPSELKKIRIPILWAPMYDGIKFNWFYWKTYSMFSNLKILSFSKTITSYIKQFDINTLNLQYYKSPIFAENNQKHTFYWDRGIIDFDIIKKVINPKDIDSLTLLKITDPGKQGTSVSPDDIKTYKINLVEADFLPSEKYLEYVQRCNIFVAPRKKEGIGMSFIEALSMGKVVIGYDDATLNEYITHDTDGYLFKKNPSFLDLSNIENIKLNSKTRYEEGYKAWQRDKDQIIPFFLSPSKKEVSKISLNFWIMVYNLRAMIHKRFYQIKKYL
jgi:glycosyltransferase involved in cell wall biosynthesis